MIQSIILFFPPKYSKYILLQHILKNLNIVAIVKIFTE